MIGWLQSFFDNFSDFERINICLIIILVVGLIGGWVFNDFKYKQTGCDKPIKFIQYDTKRNHKTPQQKN